MQLKFSSLARPLCALALAVVLTPAALADVIRMKDGQVIRGQIVGFRDQQFTVLIGSGDRGRRSRITLYVEDVESIEFESAGSADLGSTGSGATTTVPRTQDPINARTSPAETRPAPASNTGGTTSTQPRNTGSGTPASGSPQFFPIRVRVRADNAANGWTDSGLMVRRGQRLRITASGRVSLGQGRFSTPTGLPRIVDTEKLMRNEPTGALIAVVGDDNDDFIFVGSNREFVATRDGRLFLGVNEGNLNDNTGTYDVLIEAEPMTGGGR